MREEIPNMLVNMIRNGENTNVEFKEAQTSLPSTLFETVCGMLNRSGGHIFLGINDSGKVFGVKEEIVKKIKKDFVNQCNNPEKIHPTIHLEIKEFLYESKVVLYIFVYESSDVHKVGNKIIDRNEDGDFDISSNTNLISNLYIRKSNTYIENKIYPYATLKDLRKDLIEKARRMAMNRTSNHPWTDMDDLQLLRSASLYEKNLQSGEEGINLAGLLLLGTDEVIYSALSYYRTDAILKIKNINRYDDRDDIRTNLIESYERLVNFMKKHLNDQFYIEGDKNINIRDVIARELCSNILIHREYSNPFPAKLIITADSVRTENANKPRNIGFIDLNNYSPYPKNPKIANFFKEIGLAEELGSGIKTITKYSKVFSGKQPSFKDDEIFRVYVPLINNTIIKKIDYEELKNIIYEYIKSSDGLTRKEINEYIYPLEIYANVQKTNEKIHNILSYLRSNNKIKNIGKNNNSLWLTTEKIKTVIREKTN